MSKVVTAKIHFLLKTIYCGKPISILNKDPTRLMPLYYPKQKDGHIIFYLPWKQSLEHRWKKVSVCLCKLGCLRPKYLLQTESSVSVINHLSQIYQITANFFSKSTQNDFTEVHNNISFNQSPLQCRDSQVRIWGEYWMENLILTCITPFLVLNQIVLNPR